MDDWSLAGIIIGVLVLALLALLIICCVLSMREIPGIPPGPSFLPLVGNVIDMSWKYRSRKYKYFEKMEKEYGSVYRLYFGRQLMIFLNDIESVKEAFVEKRDIFTDRPSDKFWVARQVQKGGTGIVWSNDQLWEHTHYMAVRGFQDLNIEEKVLAETESILSEFSKQENQPMALNKILIRSTSSIVGELMFGKKFEYDDPDYVKILKFLIQAFEGEGPFTPLNMLPQLRYLPGARGKFKELVAGAEHTKAYISKKIVEHQKTWNKERPRDLIDCGLTAIADADSQEFNSRILMYSLLDLYLAGSDTTANSLDWAFLHMIVNTDAQIKCQKEIDEVVGSERRVVWADKPNMPYCTATLMECHRHSNVSMSSLPHTATKDTKIKGFVIPKGCIILAGISSIHHDANLWENPEQFNPDRFIDGDRKIIHSGNLIPYGIGPRLCPGAALARMELFLIFCNVLQRYSLSKIEGSEIDLDGNLFTTLSPKPYLLTAKSRVL